MNDTYILLARSILDSEVFASQKMLKIWIWCLCKASHKDRFVSLKFGKGEQAISIKRGQFLFGRNKAKEELFIDGSTIYKIMKRLELLENISIKSNNQYSIVTICNYNIYQDPDKYQVASKSQVSNKQVTSKSQVSNTNIEFNNVKNVKNVKNMYADFLILFNSITKRNYRGCEKSQRQFYARIKNNYTITDFKKAITNCFNDKYHKENPKYLTPEFITRSNKLDNYLNYEKPKATMDSSILYK